MTKIWGFDLSLMHWSAFRHASMFDKRWHLRRERFIVYQLAMLICLAAECIATYSLSKYEKHQSHIEEASQHEAYVHNNDLIAAECLTIVFCVFVATLFGAEFFFLLFWPNRIYPRWYNITRKTLAVGITCGVLAAALMSSFVVANGRETINNIDPQAARLYAQMFSRPPLQYNQWGPNIAYVVFLWLGFIFTLASTIILFIAEKHDSQYGTEPRQRRISDGTLEQRQNEKGENPVII